MWCLWRELTVFKRAASKAFLSGQPRSAWAAYACVRVSEYVHACVCVCVKVQITGWWRYTHFTCDMSLGAGTGREGLAKDGAGRGTVETAGTAG